MAAGNPEADDEKDEVESYKYFGDEELDERVRRAVEQSQNAINRLSAKRTQKLENSHHKQPLNVYGSQYSDYLLNQYTHSDYKDFSEKKAFSPIPNHENSLYISSSPVLDKYGNLTSLANQEFLIISQFFSVRS